MQESQPLIDHLTTTQRQKNTPPQLKIHPASKFIPRSNAISTVKRVFVM